jgi:hypothetical protein
VKELLCIINPFVPSTESYLDWFRELLRIHNLKLHHLVVYFLSIYPSAIDMTIGQNRDTSKPLM